MKLDLRQPIKDYRGRPIPGSDGKPATIREYFDTALNNIQQGEVLTAEVKAQAYQISNKLYGGNTVDLTLPERNFLIERIGKIWLSPLICGRLTDILEEREAPEILSEEELDGVEGEDKKAADPVADAPKDLAAVAAAKDAKPDKSTKAA